MDFVSSADSCDVGCGKLACSDWLPVISSRSNKTPLAHSDDGDKKNVWLKSLDINDICKVTGQFFYKKMCDYTSIQILVTPSPIKLIKSSGLNVILVIKINHFKYRKQMQTTILFISPTCTSIPYFKKQ